MFFDKAAKRAILSQMVKCSNWKRKCDWSGELSSLEVRSTSNHYSMYNYNSSSLCILIIKCLLYVSYFAARTRETIAVCFVHSIPPVLPFSRTFSKSFVGKMDCKFILTNLMSSRRICTFNSYSYRSYRRPCESPI